MWELSEKDSVRRKQEWNLMKLRNFDLWKP